MIILASTVLLAVGVIGMRAQDVPVAKANGRKLLYPASEDQLPQALRPVVRKLLATDQTPVQPGDVKPAGIFARVVTKKFIVEGRRLKDRATLGDRPFVFVTLPESLYGKSLLEMFSTIGYSADDVVVGQLGEEKVLLVFRWEAKMALQEGRDGKLPETWHSAVYPTTWDNVFALVGKMAADKDWHVVQADREEPVLTKLTLRSPQESLFLQGYPDAGKKRINASSYYALREVGGADWAYRSILERSLGLAEHFTGDGTSKPTLTGQRKLPRGYPEFIGPNRSLTALPELAVIDLGALRVSD